MDFSDILDSEITVTFRVMGKTYEVFQFNIGFTQPTDEKGKPQAEIRGGRLMVTLGQTVGDEIYNWALSRWMQKDGEVIFSKETGSSPLKISFKRILCALRTGNRLYGRWLENLSAHLSRGDLTEWYHDE